MKLNENEYRQLFSTTDSENKANSIQKMALERAWKNRDFEIELYWKRATYFWAFIGATFAGYLVILKYSDDVSAKYLELVLAIMGFIFSLAWYLVNKGSKKWQENWEKHIDMLEDEITGPIYKTVLNMNAPSVSRVNMNVSLFVTTLWGFFIFNYFLGDHYKDNLINLVLIVILIVFLVILLDIPRKLHLGKGREEFSFKLRRTKYEKS